jgi:hypothetical protein
MRKFVLLPLLAVLAHCGGTVAPSGVDAGVDGALDASPAPCTNGETRKVDCNTCTCMNGAWACTGIACIDGGPVPPSDPGSVTCAGKPCASSDHFCCDQQGVESCMAQPEPGTCAGPQRVCDEAADCQGGQVCCIPPNANIVVAYFTQCAKTCGINDPYQYQVCKTSAECQNGQPCLGQLCQGKMIFTCGGQIPSKRCP